MSISVLSHGSGFGSCYEGLDDAARLEYIDRVMADVGRLEALLKVLHSFSMFENLSLGPVELGAFIRDLMPTIEPVRSTEPESPARICVAIAVGPRRGRRTSMRLRAGFATVRGD